MQSNRDGSETDGTAGSEKVTGPRLGRKNQSHTAINNRIRQYLARKTEPTEAGKVCKQLRQDISHLRSEERRAERELRAVQGYLQMALMAISKWGQDE